MNGQPVRIVTGEEVVNEYKHWRKGPMLSKPVDWGTLKGLDLLQRAAEIKDLTAARTAVQILNPFLRRTLKPGPGEKDPEELIELIIQGVIPYEAVGEQWFLPRWITSAVKNIRFVSWTPGKSKDHSIPMNPPRRGVLCPDYESAVAYRTFFNGIRVCLHCQEFFRQRRPKQSCCSPECGGSHRVARCREKKKRNAANPKGKQR